MMYEQYVVRPETKQVLIKKRDVLKMDRNDFLTGSGFVRAIPGPVFSIGSFTGGMVLKNEENKWMQFLGCILGSLGIFTPSVLLVLFFFPVWHNLKKYAAIYRSLEGINAAVVGILSGATVYLLKDLVFPEFLKQTLQGYLDLTVIFITFLILIYTKIPAPFIVLGCLILGWFL